MIDTRRLVETPEGVDLYLIPAGPAARAQAWLLDTGIRLLILLGVGSVMALLGATGSGLYLLVLFSISWFYFPVFERLAAGATPGKRILKLKVVHDDGTPIGWSASIIRNLLRGLDSLPVGYACGLVSMLLARDFRRLGDLAAGTIVVHAESWRESVPLPEIEPLPPPVPLSPEERRAVVDFALRVPALTRERAEELAVLLCPGTAGRDAVRTLRGYAAWIVGRQ